MKKLMDNFKQVLTRIQYYMELSAKADVSFQHHSCNGSIFYYYSPVLARVNNQHFEEK